MSELSHRVLDFIDDTTDRLHRDLRSMRSEMMSGFVASPPSRPRSRAPTRSQQHGPGVRARTTLALEYAALRHAGHCPLGMYVVPRTEDPCVWDAVFFVHQGYYTDSILKFRVIFPADYPTHPPAVQFLTDVFHPLVSQTDGSFNLTLRFRPWRPQEHHVFDVLHWVKAAFKKHALDSLREEDCLNKEAFRLYHDTTSSFAALATQSAMLSQSASALFDRDHPSMAGKGTHEMLFRELKPEQLAALRAKIGLKEWEDPAPAQA